MVSCCKVPEIRNNSGPKYIGQETVKLREDLKQAVHDLVLDPGSVVLTEARDCHSALQGAHREPTGF